MDYQYKYLKYKNKYLQIKNNKNQVAGQSNDQSNGQSNDQSNGQSNDQSNGQSNDQSNGQSKDQPLNLHQNISDANNSFTIKLFENLEGASNIYSPLSVVVALSLVHLAALGNTDRQLTKLFNYKYSKDDLEEICKLFKNDDVKMVNMILINKDYKINPAYINMINDMAIIIQDNFENGPKIAAQINNYIGKKTNGLIKNLVDANDIKDNMIFVLINTIYFKAEWENKFKSHKTTKMKFHKTNMVDMMYQKSDFNYYENSKIQAIEMPYKNSNIVMGVILPKRYLEEDNMDYSANNVPIISSSEINEIINNMSFTEVKLYLPKFTQRKNLELVPILRKMGVIDLFDSNYADLNIASKKSFVSKIIHEAVVIVDENGTEATAATTIFDIDMMANPMMKKPEIIFKADHAFIYYIRYVPSNLFLFYGDYQGV